MFSKSCEYGIKAALFIATQSITKKRVKIGDIVRSIDSPEAFTGKILGVLSKNKIVDSYTGPNGGFEINEKNLHLITIADIVKAIDGDSFFNDCVLGLSHCDENRPCPMHNTIALIRTKMRKELQSTTLFELATKIENRDYLLLR